MKYLKYIAILAAAVSMAASCETNLDTVEVPSASEYVAPVLNGISDVIVNRDNNAVEAVTFTWSPASFGAPVQIAYSLYLVKDGVEVLAGTSFSNSLSIAKSDLNGVVCNDLGVATNSQANISAYLKTCIYNTEITTNDSNSIQFNITTYAAPLRSIYLPGKYNGWGQFNGEFWETDGGSNIYQTLVDVSNSEETPYYFKLVLSDGSWTGFDKVATDGWDVADPDNGDRNYSVTADEPYVWLSVNLNTKKISKETVSHVELRGSFDSWGEGAALAYNPSDNVWTADVTFEDDGEMLLLLNQKWDGYKFGNGTTPSFDIPGGVILDQDNNSANISVPAGSYTMKLYANRTPFVLVMDKQ